MSTFANTAAAPLFSFAKPSKMGAIARHGLHHDAVKSTTKRGSALCVEGAANGRLFCWSHVAYSVRTYIEGDSTAKGSQLLHVMAHVLDGCSPTF